MRAKVSTSKDLRFLLPIEWARLDKYAGENFAVQVNPLSGTFGDSIISRHFYRIRDHRRWVKIHDPETHLYMKARKIFLRRAKKRNGGSLYCEYCNKGPLKADAGNIFSKLPMATIDHKIPLSKGGNRFDFDNMACSCSKCNSKKKDKLL